MHRLYLLLLTYASAYEYGYYVEEGAKCVKRTGVKGICTHFANCPSAIEEVRHRSRPEICSFAGIYPIVCCRKNDSPYSEKVELKFGDSVSNYHPLDEQNISLKKCREYHSKIETSRPTNIKSSTRENPHMALLGVLHGSSIKWTCSGALISEKFILTAAQCVDSLKSNYVQLGDFDVRANTINENSQDFRIMNIHKHPDYEFSRLHPNLALVQLDKPAKFNDYVRPACIGITENFNVTLPEIAGWELDYENPSYKLETYYLKYISNRICDNLIHGNTDICAVNGRACDMSYGSPLQASNFFYEFNNFPEILGVISLPESCDERKLPGVYTKVYPYMSWIKGIVWPEFNLTNI